MPLIRVELLEGRSPEQKRELARALTEATTRTLGCKPDAVDVMFFDVRPSDWVSAGIPWDERLAARKPG